MLIDKQLKYSYNDVSVIPAYVSTIEHRNECNPFLEDNKLPIFTAPMSTVVNLDNFVLSGQWIMAPGGLPIAIFTGKHAICRICKSEKKKFIELDKNITINATDN